MDSTTPLISNSSSEPLYTFPVANIMPSNADTSAIVDTESENEDHFMSLDEDDDEDYEDFLEALDSPVVDDEPAPGNVPLVRPTADVNYDALSQECQDGDVNYVPGDRLRVSGITAFVDAEVSEEENEGGVINVLEGGIIELEKETDTVLENSGVNNGAESVSRGNRIDGEEKNRGEVVEEGIDLGGKEKDRVERSAADIRDSEVVEVDGVSVGDSVVEDVGLSVTRKGSHGRDDGVAVFEFEGVNVDNQFSQMSNEVEENLELSGRKTDGVERSVTAIGDSKVVEVGDVGGSVMDDIDVDLSGSGMAVVGNDEGSGGSDDGDKDVAIVETESANVDNRGDEVEELLELKSAGAESDSVKNDETNEVELGEQMSGTTECVDEEDAEKVSKFGNDVKQHPENVAKSLLTSLDDDELVDGKEEVKSVRDSVVEDVDIDMSGSGVAIDGNVEENRGSDDGDKDAAFVETVSVNVDNQFSQINDDVEEPLGSKSQGAERDSAGSDENAEEELNEGKSGPAVCVKEDAEEVRKSADLVEKQLENGGTSPLDDTEFYGMVDGKERSGPTIDSKVEQNEPTSVAHVPAGMPTSIAREDITERDIGEKNGAASSYINRSEQVAPSETDVRRNLEDEFSEFAKEGEVKPNFEDNEKQYPEEVEAKGSETDEESKGLAYESSEVAKQFLEELKKESSFGSYSGADGSLDYSQNIDGEIVTDSDEEDDEANSDEDGNELFDSAALTALLKAATNESSNGGSVTITSQDEARLFSVERPAGLGSSVRSLKPVSRPIHPNVLASSDLTASGDIENNLSEEEKTKLKQLQQIRIKFLRFLHRLGYSPEDSMARQVLYRLALSGGMQSGQLFNLESAKTTALQLDSDGKCDSDFSLNVLVLGKSGTGKSATINSIFGEERSQIHAFKAETNVVQEIVGTVDGIRIKIVDTPGLASSAVDQNANRKILSSVKKFTKKCPPDVVLYIDRLDTHTKDLNDLPLLRSITNSLGPSIWRNAIVTLTHAASTPPDGQSGSPLSYEVFVAQRSHIVQQSIAQAVGDLRMMNPSLMNPVSLVENHPSCSKNKDGQKVLPNGQSWRSQLLFLCYSLQILSEANSLSKAHNRVDQSKLFGFRVRSPPLPYILSWLLQSRTHPKLSTDQSIDNGDFDVDVANLTDSEEENEDDEYDQLPPFTPLKKSQLAMLSKEQKQAYFEEYDYRVKLLQKKQWKEELKRITEIKKIKINVDAYSNSQEDVDQDDGAPATVSVPLPDMTLPHSFDSDNPAYRFRFLEPTSKLLTRPVLDTHGWDHDCGYDGVNIEHSLDIASQFPAALAIQLTKDKKEFNIHFDSSVATKHGESGSTMAGFDIQHVGKQLSYTVRGETKFKNLKRNKTAAGVSMTLIGENIATGFKLEDEIALGNRLMLAGSTGTVRSQGHAAYGTNLEVRLREADYPIGQNQSSLGLSLVKWRGDLALGANLQSQFSIGRSSKIAVRMGLNNKRSGQISIRTSTSDQLQIALVGIIPVAMAIYYTIRPGVSENYSLY